MCCWQSLPPSELISSECPLHKLDLSCKLADNQIKTDILPFIYSLATNDTLKELDISGNAMGDKGMYRRHGPLAERAVFGVSR
jgi:Ran GTPase-activating protein (RanGAP) involved in mRNA processing and transport